MSIYFDSGLDGVAKRLKEEMQELPTSRYDCRAFVWQDVFYEGNYCAAPTDAKGTARHRVFVQRFLKYYHADKSHFNNFEVELDGMRLHDYFVFEGQKQEHTGEGFEKHDVSLYYPDKDARIHVCTLLDGSSFMLRWLEVENAGKKPFAVTGIFPMAGILYSEDLSNNFRAEHLRPKAYVGCFNDNYYLAEGEFRWTELPKATLKFGHEHPIFNPQMYVLREDVSCMMTMIHIETGMMTQAEFTRCGDYNFSRNITNQDYVHFKVGADKRATYRTVQPGERVVSPKIHFGQMYGDLDDCVNAFNEHLRLSVIPKRNQKILYPIEYSHASGTDCCQIDKEFLLREIDKAAAFGGEVFVIDAGWFGSCKGDWYRQRGDWFETEYLENDLTEVFDYARSKGLMCGLWMEAEGMDFSSQLAKEHPDWFIKAYGRNIPTLNLMLPQVREYVYNSICGVIEKYRLDLFRIDGGLKEPSEEKHGKVTEQTSWKYYEYLYEILSKVRERFPNVYFENCSGGGGRSDFAIMRHFDWMQATDSIAPAAQLRVVYGMTLAFAPELIMSLTQSERLYNDPDFIARSALLGRVQFSGLTEKLENVNEYCLKAWQRALKIYREDIRPILPTSRIYHHTPFTPYMEKGEWLVWELSSQGQDKSVMGVFRYPGEETGEYLVRPRGLSMSKRYEVYFDNSGEKIEMTGADLHRNGFPVRITGNLMSEMIVFTEKKG